MSKRFLSLCCIAALLTACGGGSPGGGDDDPDEGDGAFTAKINGAAWSSPQLYRSATGSATPGAFILVGGSTSSANPALSLILQCIRGPGTYPLGVSGVVPGGIATLSQASSAWSTPLSGIAGSVTVSAVSTSQISGTFSFVAEPTFGAGAGNKTVTNGSFNLPLTTPGSLAVPANACNTAAGTLGGSPFTAATVVMVSAPLSGTLAIGLSNNQYLVNIFVSGVNGAGTYTMNTGVSRFASVMTTTGTTQYWGGTNGLSAGTFTITSLTASRVVGTYNITLQPGVVSPGPGTMTLSGAFDLGIPQ